MAGWPPSLPLPVSSAARPAGRSTDRPTPNMRAEAGQGIWGTPLAQRRISQSGLLTAGRPRRRPSRRRRPSLPLPDLPTLSWTSDSTRTALGGERNRDERQSVCLHTGALRALPSPLPPPPPSDVVSRRRRLSQRRVVAVNAVTYSRDKDNRGGVADSRPLAPSAPVCPSLPPLSLLSSSRLQSQRRTMCECRHDMFSSTGEVAARWA